MAEESRNVGSRVIVIEPGWVVVHFTAPPEASERLSFLNRTLEDWFRDHPDCKLESVHPVESGGVLRGLNAYYHMEVRREGKLKLRVDAALLGQYGQEYIEAVVSEAIPQWTRPTLPANTFAIVNRRHVAIVVDRRREQAYITKLEQVEAALPPQSRAELQNWLQNLDTHLFLCPMPDGFRPQWGGPGPAETP